MERVNDNVQRVAANMNWANRHMRLEEFVTDVAESTVRLVRTIEAHEQRVSDEGNQEQ